MGLLLLCVLTAAAAVEFNDDTYYAMPPLYLQDDYEQCLATRGTYCLGSFHLSGSDQNEIANIIKAYSSQVHRFNHTLMHRGICLSSTCPHIEEQLAPTQRFERCVRNLTSAKYGLNSKLVKFEYCKTRDTPPLVPIDGVDFGFLAVCVVILLGNVVGTLYDVFRDQSNKPNRLLVAWSLRANFKRLAKTFENDDTNMSRLNPIHGAKAIFLMLVMMAHSVIIYHSAYLYNPLFLEINRQHPLAAILHNGSVIVQTFIILSCFLFTYNFLLHVESNPEKKFGFRVFFGIILHRLARITPISLFMVGFTATWNRFVSDGALWRPIMEKQCQSCREKWWAQALYINNFYKPDTNCLLQTWFLAVDMQLYVLAVIITMLVVRWKKTAVKILGGLVITAVVANFIASYYFDLKAIVFVTYPELLRNLYEGERSFKWLYAAPWGSLPCSLLGVFLGFLYYHLKADDVKVSEYKWFRIVYRFTTPCMLAWILSGYFLQGDRPRFVTALYAALDRPVFGAVMCTMLLGMFYRIDNFWWRFLSWGGWQILGRMSLSVLMTHWSFNLFQIAIQSNLSRISFFDVAGHWYVTMFATYTVSFPIHLLVEVPLQKFLQAVLGV
ncbi:unnamed protein product [Colias eurytheme]|nr:unnamed protein product [Colias eurytheme]